MDKRRMSVDEQQIECFFAELKTPNNLDAIRSEVNKFCDNNLKQRIVLITVRDVYYNLINY